MTRVAGVCGTLPALIPALLHELEHYFAGSLPTPPASVSVPDISAWGMDGNDSYGDCGVAGIHHGFMAAGDIAGNMPADLTTDQIVQYYLKYTDGQDSGVVLSQFLKYIQGQSQGFYGNKVEAYAPVAPSNLKSLHFTIDAYDFAYTGIAVTAGMQEAFQNGEPWGLNALQSPVVGGHCIPLVGYDSDYLYAVTWGGIQKIAYSAWHYIASEAWAIITSEVAKGDGRGLSLSALQQDLRKL